MAKNVIWVTLKTSAEIRGFEGLLRRGVRRLLPSLRARSAWRGGVGGGGCFNSLGAEE
jgi:hypothetical protein